MKTAVFLILVITVTYGLGQWLSQRDLITTETAKNNIRRSVFNSQCDPTKSSCEFVISNITYLLEFKSAPSALVPFVVSVKTSDVQPDAIALTFDMNGMEMGYNSHRLVKSESEWQAKVILPVCSLGRNDWLLDVEIINDGEVSVTRFKFSQFK